MKYYLIDCTEDGEVDIKEYTEPKLLKMLNADPEEYEFSSSLPPEGIEYFTGQILIKGEIIVPRPKKIVEKFEL